MRALMRTGRPTDPPQDIDRRVALRLTRQGRLTGPPTRWSSGRDHRRIRGPPRDRRQGRDG